jgi:phosphatidylglycerol:prolipoprotein diacylglycerol transferase
MYPYIPIAGSGLNVYTLCLAAGIITCLMLFLNKRKMFSLRIYELVQSIPFALGFALVGGKMLSLATLMPMFFRAKKTFAEALLSVGFVFYGGFAGLLVGLFLESRRRHKDMLRYTDTFFRLFPLGQAIGRIGCFFNGCCYGRPTDSWIGVMYPVRGIDAKIMPTQLMESLFCLGLAGFLLCWKTEQKGFYTVAYVVLYASFRFVIEFYRGDSIRGVWGLLSTSQWISLILLLISLVISMYKLMRRSHYTRRV